MARGDPKAHWRPFVLAMILAAAANAVAYALTSYMPTYLTSNKGYSEVEGTLLTIPVLVAMALCIPFTGLLSDRIGRRCVLWIGAFSTVVLAVPAFRLFRIRVEVGYPIGRCTGYRAGSG